jgi:DNA-binding NarL/FixJ family response regulator
MAKKITVLLVDDHSLVRRGFRRMLEDESDMEVVGEAGDGEKAIKLAKELHPKVMVMDCALPGMNGLQATRQIMEDSPETARSYAQHAQREHLGAAGRRCRGQGICSEECAGSGTRSGHSQGCRGRNCFRSAGRAAFAAEGRAQRRLTQRELEVLQMIVDGKSNKEIATVLELSANTVAVHRANIMNSLGIHKTAELVVYAIRAGLVNVP